MKMSIRTRSIIVKAILYIGISIGVAVTYYVQFVNMK